MKIIRRNQYNQGVGKNKLLSSNSGVGAIITTKLGFYILVSDINKWKFIKWANARIESIRSINTDEKIVYETGRNEILGRGLDFLDDKRFIKFLRQEKDLQYLVCLIGIPHMALNESFNTPNWTNHPIKKALERLGESSKGVSGDYMINATHFPKWFKNSKGELKKLDEWYRLWQEECKRYPDNLKYDYFAPPRDCFGFVKEVKAKNEDGNPIKIREYKILDQTNLILICPNGHLSDIPWPNYLRWKTDRILRRIPADDPGENLLFSDSLEACCASPQLKWTESKTKSEGYKSIFIECQNCMMGSGNSPDNPKIDLEGINNLQPRCAGHKPWELEIEELGVLPIENCIRHGVGGHERMRIALVTGNNVYFGNGFSSLFIPYHLADNTLPDVQEALSIVERKYQRFFERTQMSKSDYWMTKFNLADFIIENDMHLSNEEAFVRQLRDKLLGNEENEGDVDFHEDYRWQEYQCFANNSSLPDEERTRGLNFCDIDLGVQLKEYFMKIQQVEQLKVINVQLDFTRVKPKERIVSGGQISESVDGKNIFSTEPNQVFVLPANETLGEGIFFQFSDERISTWIADHADVLNARFQNQILAEPSQGAQGAGTKRKIFNNGIKHFLIHSFAHLMMRELEFSCGYPTASLKERLYISNNPKRTMAGVLIYTAEGAEGSMGGLVSQGEPDKLFELMKSGMERSGQCSSDPLCWESDGQGLFDLNHAACFSCSLVSETACEEMNLGLDRRVLIDEDFGFFKELI